jgi:hypothetical protein
VTFPSPAQAAPLNEGNAASFAARSWDNIVGPVELATALFSSILFYPVGTIDDTVAGSAGGVATIRGVRESATGGWLWIELDDYGDGSVVLDGRVVQSGEITSNGLAHDVTFELTNLSVREGGVSTVMTGTIADRVEMSAKPGRTTIASMSIEVSTGERLWLENVKAQRQRTVLFASDESYSGRLHYGGVGFVDIVSDAPYTFISNETAPDRGGALRLIGANASVGLVPLNPSHVALVIDQNKDGVDDAFARRTWPQLMTGAAATNMHSPAIANAGAKRTVGLGETVELDALLSRDRDGSFLRTEWTLAIKPVGSTATLSTNKPLTPTFIPDKVGNYLFTVRVVDPDGDAYDSVEIRVVPSAWVGDRRVRMRMDRPAGGPTGGLASLDASMSRREDLSNEAPLDVLYSWTLAGPFGSSAALSNATTATTSFIPDRPGFYRVRTENGVPSPNYQAESHKVVGFGTGLQYYEPAHLSTGGSHFNRPIVADFDHDGDADLASIGFTPTMEWAIRVFRRGPAAELEEVDFTIDNEFNELIYGDLNGDGFGDLATVSAEMIHVVYLGSSIAASLVRHIALPGRAGCFASSLWATIVDVDGNGANDLLVADSCLLEMQIRTHTSNGDLVVARRQSLPELAGRPVAFGDLTGDGRPDFVVPRVPGYPTNPDALLVFRRLSNGDFSLHQSVEFSPGFFAIGDFTGDGRNDLVAARSPTISVFAQDSSGNLRPRVDYTVDTSLEAAPRFADLNGDSRLDVIIGSGISTSSLLLGLQQASGPPSFFVLPELELARDTTNVVAADFNSDGRVDLLLPRENFSEPGFAVRLRQP